MKNILTLIFIGFILVGISACSKYYENVTNSTIKKETKRPKFHGGSTAISDKPSDMAKSTRGMEIKDQSFHGDSLVKARPPKMFIVEALKQNKLNGYPQKNIGEAFDSYNRVTTKEWQEAAGKDGKLYVDCIFWFDRRPFLSIGRQVDAVRTGLAIKFVIQENGDTHIALITKLQKSDGKVQSDVIPFPEIQKIVDAIYNNKDIKL